MVIVSNSSASKRKQSLKKILHFNHIHRYILPLLILILLSTTFIISVAITYPLIFQQHAAEQVYVTTLGTGHNGYFKVSDPVIKENSSRFVTLSWTSNVPSKSKIVYKQTGFPYDWLFFIPPITMFTYDYSAEQEVTLTERISGNQSYSYQITSYTENGESFTSPTYTFTTPSE